ncbi:LamB/YcsF family protein [Dermacoccus sp. PAMC28757]|uniref:LamB/YcsF family protein n=1 Tax=Dermacoccus sp. PAMC28757 TaxID=2762331 RepID=UPI00164E0170|nr:5-oxoprolinase subunit PxpA [Dermacoccus sp. PAMC28757]QNK52641.1 LamB/YcsF family protein [Dermacoccus sp. PAMC28757]
MSADARTIDLNADMGESFGAWTMGDDAALLDVVSSANVACGFHAGDPLVLARTCAAAAERGVTIGAHVAYRDLTGFGRTFVDVEPARLKAEVLYQLAAIDGVARAHGTSVGYVKPHGALYNAIVHHEAQAEAVVRAVERFNAAARKPLAILGLPGGVVLDLAESRGIRAVREAFADRAYTAEGTLVPRREPGAVLHDPALVAERMLSLVTTGEVEAIDGSRVRVDAESICVHGDSPGAVDMAVRVKESLTGAGAAIAAFV